MNRLISLMIYVGLFFSVLLIVMGCLRRKEISKVDKTIAPIIETGIEPTPSMEIKSLAPSIPISTPVETVILETEIATTPSPFFLTPSPTTTITVTMAPTPSATDTPTGPLLQTGVTYVGVMTAFSDKTGSHGDILINGNCAVGRRNYLLEGSTRAHTIDSGIPIYKYSYVPYGSKLRLTLYNDNSTIKRVIEVIVKDDCLKRNQEKIIEVRKYNESRHPEINWDEIEIWVDLWVPLEEKEITSIRQIGVEIISFGEWDEMDLQ